MVIFNLALTSSVGAEASRLLTSTIGITDDRYKIRSVGCIEHIFTEWHISNIDTTLDTKFNLGGHEHHKCRYQYKEYLKLFHLCLLFI